MIAYDDAEQRGFDLFRAGEHERAIRMFELAQTLPGEGVEQDRARHRLPEPKPAQGCSLEKLEIVISIVRKV